MNASHEHILIAIGIAILAYAAGKQHAAKAAAAHPDVTPASGTEWWNYAGTWGM